MKSNCQLVRKVGCFGQLVNPYFTTSHSFTNQQYLAGHLSVGAMWRRAIKSQMNLDHTKSLVDEKNYRVLSLLSGLEVLLVSTKAKTEARGEVNVKAAAAMSVQVGSFADPELAEGTAHFLEVGVPSFYIASLLICIVAYGIYGQQEVS